MASGLDFPTFYDRFEDLRRRLRRHLGWQTLTVLAICSLLGFVVVAGLDYRFELPWMLRAISIGSTSAAGLLLSVWLLIVGLASWSRYRTASAIERKFPELGQRVRTTVEYRGRSTEQLKQAGVAPGLVRALETEAAVSTLPLPLENLIPMKRLIALTGFAFGIVGFVASAGMWHGEWQTAMRRALLADESFTQLVLGTEDSIVDKGASLNLRVTVTGRPRDTVMLRTRPSTRTNGPWDVQTFTVKDADVSGAGELVYESSIPNITEPFEFQWAAGPEQSAQCHVDVRYPLQIVNVSVEVTPPQYTGLPPAINGDGNVNVLEGSQAKFVIELDGVPASAQIIFNPALKSKYDDFEPITYNVQIDGTKLMFETVLERDVNWLVDATSPHGLPIAKNSYRIRVRKDQPPTVYFEEPNESLDVHSLAEILMRIRARDDFGLTRAGIVFQINNDEEHTLFAESYQQAADELQATGTLSPKTSAALERTLPLEHFKLIQKDAITYYAFAEDNRPGEPQRTETELRFIDIRPFKTIYRQPPERDGMGDPQEQGPRRATFEELIARQRTALNRTLTMKRSNRPDLGGLDRLMKFEGEIAELTRGLAVFLQAQAERFNIPQLLDNADLLFQAERAMLDSVDSMSVGKFDVAMLQEKDAVRFLVESRDRLEVILQESKSGELQNAIGDFFRQQQTKMRRKPQRSKDEQQKIEDLLAQLAQLAGQEGTVAAQLQAMGSGGGSSETPPTDTEQQGNQNGTPPTPEKDANSTSPEKGDGGNASEDKEETPNGRGGMTREEITKKQQEIAADAAEVQKELSQLRQATDLAKGRMAAATEAAEAASGALARGNSKEAAKSATIAAEKFEQLLTLAQGLLAEELSDQLNVARDIADDISRQEEDLANAGSGGDRNAKTKQPGAGQAPADDQEKQEAMANQAEKLAVAGESLADILNAASKSTSKEDQKVIPKVTELMDKGGVSSTVERMQQQASGFRGGKVDDERKAAADIADKMDETARKLDTLQREIVNPKVAELMKLEADAQRLADETDDVETKRQAEQFMKGAGQFVEELKDAEVGGGAGEELKDELKGDGWDEETNTVRSSGARFDGERYRRTLRNIEQELRETVQQLLLAELAISNEEIPPAQYEALVMKYQRTLTMGAKGSQTKSSRAKERRKN